MKLQYMLLWSKRTTSSFEYEGKQISLCVVDPDDEVQKIQKTGTFYEMDELLNLRRHINQVGTFVDIGANTGQHGIFAAKFMNAQAVIYFEPIPTAYKILRENVKLNGMEKIANLNYIGIGLSDKSGRVSYTSKIGNLGATTLNDSSTGSLILRTGDDLLTDHQVDFIKIDTEGHEIKVLQGLVKTIAANRPRIYIEIDNNNLEEFIKLLDNINYKIVFESKKYEENSNFLICPV